MLKAPRPVSRRHELREDQLATATARSLTFYEEHRTLLIGSALAVLAVIAGLIGYRAWQNGRNEAAAERLGGVLTAYEQGQYEAALDGAGGQPGLLRIAEDYGSTQTGNLATFYAADALFQLGRYDQALRYFQRYDGEDDLLGASALAGQAAVYEQQGEHARAAELFERAAGAFESIASAPDYLMAAARNYEAAQQWDAARRAYDAIDEDYAESPVAQMAAMHRARMEAQAPLNAE
ncbi:MAG TPA: tetratricopeptide repeat protein [Rubricoccaceae bacterium]|nr:tetratricopeptide repeat protein [Rubricoccaceae bacterium]